MFVGGERDQISEQSLRCAQKKWVGEAQYKRRKRRFPCQCDGLGSQDADRNCDTPGIRERVDLQPTLKPGVMSEVVSHVWPQDLGNVIHRGMGFTQVHLVQHLCEYQLAQQSKNVT